MRPSVQRHDANRRRELNPLITRVRGEFLEMPGMQLTINDAARLWQLDRRSCEALLNLLVEDGFLVRTSSGAFVAASHTE